MRSDLLVLLDTNIYIGREGHHNVPYNVAMLFRQLDELGVRCVLHIKSYKDVLRYENVERRKTILSKFSCYSPLKTIHDFSTDSRFLSTLKTTSSAKESDDVDNALLYEVYKGTVTHLITEDLGDLCNEVVEELRNPDGSALKLETHLPFTMATIRI